MSSKRRCCKLDPDFFCYICGEFLTSKQRLNITEFVKTTYKAYFGIQLGDQDKSWAPHKVCKTCTETLRYWTFGKRQMKFIVPMVWREPTNHVNDCYFCLFDHTGYRKRHKSSCNYPNVKSAIRPVIKIDGVSAPTFQSANDLSQDSESDTTDVEYSPNEISQAPQPFNQEDLNDLIRDLGLSKLQAILMASRLKERNLLESNTKINCYKKREQLLVPFFSKEEHLVYCNNIAGLLCAMGIENYNPEDWRLFLDSNKTSIKAVLLHNGNKYGSVPVGYSKTLKESYLDIKSVLEKVKYEDHKWIICVDLKMVNILLGQQHGYTKYPCFLCLWDSRDRDSHWTKTDWPERESLNCGEANILREALVPRDKIVFPPLHIKLGLVKQRMKCLDHNGSCFQYITRILSGVSMQKLQAGVLNGPQIRKLVQDQNFVNHQNPTEKAAWLSFVQVTKEFLGNNKAANYQELVSKMLQSFHDLGANMSIKVHYLFNHLDKFPENLGDVSDEQGE